MKSKLYITIMTILTIALTSCGTATNSGGYEIIEETETVEISEPSVEVASEDVTVKEEPVAEAEPTMLSSSSHGEEIIEEIVEETYTISYFDEPKTLYCQEFSNFRETPESDGAVRYTQNTNSTAIVVGTCEEFPTWYAVTDGTWTLVTSLAESQVVQPQSPQVAQTDQNYDNFLDLIKEIGEEVKAPD